MFNKYSSERLNSFYTSSKHIPEGKPGDIIKKEEISINLPSLDKAYRILYLTEGKDGKKAISSGMIFIPNTFLPESGRTILSWAHGTTGMGDSCAPSKSDTPTKNMSWIENALSVGFVVTATDYQGLGTDGKSDYLIGSSEAMDVLNAARAARNIQEAKTGNNLLIFGQSQGGHAALFAGNMAQEYAPEFNLVAVAAAAPATELDALLSKQFDRPVSWLIGPEISISWKDYYNQLPLEKVISKPGLSAYENIAERCITEDDGVILYRTLLKQSFFKKDPVKDEFWRKVAQEQTPESLPDTPLLVIQSLDDQVVLPQTTALYIKKSCDNGSNLTTIWLNGVQHQDTAAVSGESVIKWLDQRLKGIRTKNTCDIPLPVSPAQ